jgi:hypothetical protein
MPNLIVNLPNRAKDEEVEVSPYGVFKNGHAYTLEALYEPGTDRNVEELVVGERDAKPPVAPNLLPQTEDEPETTPPPVKSKDMGGETPGAKSKEDK